MTKNEKPQEYLQNSWKNCPFCDNKDNGSKNGIQMMNISNFNGSSYYVMCGKCHATTRVCKTSEEALAAWNLRPLPIAKMRIR